jgi:hypothetical protein
VGWLVYLALRVALQGALLSVQVLLPLPATISSGVPHSVV